MRHTRNMLIMDDKTQVNGEIEKFAELTRESQQYADTMTATVKSAEGKALCSAVMEARASLLPLDEELHPADSSRRCEGRQGHAAREIASRTEGFDRRPSPRLAIIKRSTCTFERFKSAAPTTRPLIFLISLSLAAVAVGCVLAYLMTRAIKNPLNHAVAVLGEIEKGNYANAVKVHSNDEIGETLKGLQRMQVALRERTENEHAAARENARIRTALDRVSVGTMLGDKDGKIIYVNDALLALFRGKADEIRKQIASFDAEKLVGGSFEMFHHIPTLQRNNLAALTATQIAEVRVGESTLRLVANPVVDPAAKRVGTVVQWVDRTQVVATEHEVQAVVAKAIDGDLTARIREEGKEAFSSRSRPE